MKEHIEEMAKEMCEVCYSKPFCKVISAHCPIAIRDAERLYNAGYRKQEWISVEDRLPDTDEVLVYYRKGVGHAAPKKQGLDNMDWDVFFNITGTTHWMPLPEPPKMKGESK